MTSLIKERNEVRHLLRRLSPQGMERLRTYALQPCNGARRIGSR